MPKPEFKPLILFIDAYDSFSNNIISLLSTTLHASIRTIHIDNPALSSPSALHAELKHYAAVVCGPGPGHPENEEDVGLMRSIWRLSEEEMLPVLGICLGFQSLCLEFGGGVGRLRGPQHGIVRRVMHVGEGSKGKERDTIFEGVAEVNATLYQSLCVDIGQNAIGRDWEVLKWEATKQCPDLVPLAWAEHDPTEENNSGIMDERVLVGVRHKTKPFWALQYHPESICTNEESGKIIRNWFKEAQKWNRNNRRTNINLEGPVEGKLATRESLLSQTQRRLEAVEPNHATDSGRIIYHSRSIYIPSHISIIDIVETVQDLRQDQIILESSNANEKVSGGADVRGRYSIVGLDIEGCTRIEYTTMKSKISNISPQKCGLKKKISYLDAGLYGGIWPYLAQYLEQRKVVAGNLESPFWGGFMGYSTYELGLEGIRVSPDEKGRQHDRPDLCFAWVEKSLVVDHVTNHIFIQQLAPERFEAKVETWIDGIVDKLENKFLPEQSFDPYTITFSNLSPDTKKDQILDKMLEMGITLPCGLKMHYHDDYFTGFATARYLRHNDPWEIAKDMNGIQLAGQEILAQIKCKITSPTPSLKPPPDRKPLVHTSTSNIKSSVLAIQTPQASTYESKVSQCQSSIRAGNSYELCLTDQTLVTLAKPSCSSSWSLYTTLRHLQPAPFASYIKLGPLTFLSASPERFLSYTPLACELRPMKGTVRKSAEVSTLEQAKELLDIPKEKAENLMIVDLVRHDLHGVCGAGNVEVTQLMVVEEYRSVFQMISIVRGTLPSPCSSFPSESLASLSSQISNHVKEKTKYTGLDILAASLPPGSMTGAPKKRSCEILQQVETGRERSLYSGVVGYADVGGRGDWSVCIRCLFKWEDEDGYVAGDNEDAVSHGIINGNKVEGQTNNGGGEKKRERTETWHIGAGGAVTALSTPVGEREEMLTKLNGTLGLFR